MRESKERKTNKMPIIYHYENTSSLLEEANSCSSSGVTDSITCCISAGVNGSRISDCTNCRQYNDTVLQTSSIIILKK